VIVDFRLPIVDFANVKTRMNQAQLCKSIENWQSKIGNKN